MADAVTEGLVVVGEETPATTSDNGSRTRLAPRPDPDDPAAWPEGTYIEHDGERFRVADGLGAWPIIQYAKVADMGQDSDTLEGLVAIFDLASDALDARDFRRFGQHCTTRKLQGEAVMRLVWQAVELAGTHPTGSPSASDGGRPSTSPNSSGTSTQPESSPNTPEPPKRIRLVEEVPEEDRAAYLEGLSFADRKKALGIVPIDDDLDDVDP